MINIVNQTNSLINNLAIFCIDLAENGYTGSIDLRRIAESPSIDATDTTAIRDRKINIDLTLKMSIEVHDPLGEDHNA